MAKDYLCGVAAGVDLAVNRAVRRAVTHEEGIKCIFRDEMTGKDREQLIPITVDEYCDWVNGSLIQDAMPHIDADTRELFLTGMVWE